MAITPETAEQLPDYPNLIDHRRLNANVRLRQSRTYIVVSGYHIDEFGHPTADTNIYNWVIKNNTHVHTADLAKATVAAVNTHYGPKMIHITRLSKATNNQCLKDVNHQPVPGNLRRVLAI